GLVLKAETIINPAVPEPGPGVSGLAVAPHFTGLLGVQQTLDLDVAAGQGLEHQESIGVLGADRLAEADVGVVENSLLDLEQVPFQARGVGDAAELLAALEELGSFVIAAEAPRGPAGQKPAVRVLGLPLAITLEGHGGGGKIETR